MANQQPSQLAKLSRPRLYDALPRERLYALLDDASAHPGLWIAAPPGAGKTTLVAGWLESRERSGIWYQVDAGDADPASLFYYLGIGERALKAGGRKPRPLPLLTPEHLADVPGFARRYFRELFSRLSAPAVVVLDNFQEAGGGTPVFHEVVRTGIENAPPGVLIVVVSRTVPNEDFAVLSANRMLTLVDWEQIKLTRDESQRIAQLHLPMDQQLLDQLHERSGGWAAGLILLVERLRRGADIADLSAPDSLQEVFGYFAGQLFDRNDADTRRILLQLSYLPNIPDSMAEALTGSASAAKLLEQLYRRHLFTDRRHGKEPVYQFHALFRAFLQHRAQNEFDLAQQQSIAKLAAHLLEAAGQVEDAMDLRIASQDWVAARDLILTHAQKRIAQGRWRTVVDWVEALPDSVVSGNCWLLHWLGTAWIAVDPPRARSVLDRCYRKSIDDKDSVCEVQAAAGFVETYFLEYSDFAPLDRWIQVLEQVAQPGYAFPTPETELRARSAMVIALTYRQAGHPALEKLSARCLELLQTGVDVNLRLFAGVFLELYGTMCGRLDVALMTHRIVQPLLDLPDVTSLAKCLTLGIGSWTCVHTENFEEGREIIERLEMFGREENLHIGKRFACVLGSYLDFRHGDLGAAQNRIHRFEQILIPSAPYEAASIVGMKCYMGLFSGRPEHTAALGDELIRLYDRTGSLCHRLFMYTVVIWANTALNRFEEAERLIREYRKMQPSRHMEWMSWGSQVCETWMALQRREVDRLHTLLRGMFSETRPRSLGYGFATIWSRDWMPELCGLAIELGIGVDKVHDYIREYRVDAPGQHVHGWPWRVRINCLGRFEICLNGRQLDFGSKVPRKLLALLKAIVALGGHDVPEQKIADALWPDEDGDAAHQSFTTALHRLRKLLGDNSLIRQRDGRISLDTSQIWVDVLAFEALGTRGAGPEQSRAERAIALYQGEFLVHDDAPWAFAMREKLRTRYLELVSSVARRFEQDGRHEDALELYRRGIEADELAETFHQGLMRCHHQVGRTPEALEAYRRMRELLTRVHGVQPSPATEELYRALASKQAR